MESCNSDKVLKISNLRIDELEAKNTTCKLLYVSIVLYCIFVYGYKPLKVPENIVIIANSKVLIELNMHITENRNKYYHFCPYTSI